MYPRRIATNAPSVDRECRYKRLLFGEIRALERSQGINFAGDEVYLMFLAEANAALY